MQNFVAQQGIEKLLHFTQLANVPSIIANGVVPRQVLENRGAPFQFNDAYRIDGYRGASSFSISWPNYKMFWGARQDRPGVHWAVIECEASVLWDKDCVFCVENAASNAVRAVPIDQRKGVPGIQALFGEVLGKPTRAEMGHPLHYPTNPQAEVLVFGIVEPRYINAIHVQDTASRNALSAQYPGIRFCTGWENARRDYHHWR
ncbi:hypothetical protein BGV56_18720 [Burkholderia ubonensis]|uniref:DarT ssDNA thymidine ADP-ribosyltransferase family protein n=1 Tax=Burkholderia ubonensis TaxID=101571 RepID=UPI0008FD996F|nr:DarT ssDNA thymidine ADP-ribosyltransferase family protein [Burkholderia ubonensis]OJB33239.1 hypothetical protein BGV56_18720 [Burkholderia ubonensis]